MYCFDNLYHAVYTASNEAKNTDGISEALSEEIEATLIAAWQKDEFKTVEVKLPQDRYFACGSTPSRVYTEKPIAMFNAIALFMGSKNYAEVKERCPNLDKVLSDSQFVLRDLIEGELSSSKAQRKYFVCPKCGERFQLYVFKESSKNGFVNIEQVDNIISGSGNCWSCQNEPLPF